MRTTLIFVLVLLIAPGAQAFDTGPHADMTVDALRAEGFTTRAADVARVNNYFVDMYSAETQTPFSGHADTANYLIGGGLGNAEDWPDDTIAAVHDLHWDARDDSREYTGSTAGIEHEWRRLAMATYRDVQQAKADDDPLALLTVMGASLHAVQDFYAHSNWVEKAITDGPDWAAKGQGNAPTWFDVPKDVRDTGQVYSAGSTKPDGTKVRGHGPWKGDPATSMAKDWPGRPYYDQAYMAAYFGTRQWVEGIRGWLDDPAFWDEARHFSQFRDDLDWDLAGITAMSVSAGRMYGEGGVCDPSFSISNFCGDYSGDGGRLLDLRNDVQFYFKQHPPTTFRKTFEGLVPSLTVPDPLGVSDSQITFPSSRPLQALVKFVRLRTLRMHGIDLGDPLPGDGAELYQRPVIDDQAYVSPIIYGHDDDRFKAPYKPFEFLKSEQTGQKYNPPISNITVDISTADKRYAGTDDDVYLRINGDQRFTLEKRLYNDFERGDNDTYSVPIDDATRSGLGWDDIKKIEIHKSSDGLGGGWLLGGVAVYIDGTRVVRDKGINQWLEDDHRTWRATGLRRDHRGNDKVHVWIDLHDLDGGGLPLYGGDDDGDLNGLDRRDTINVAYKPGALPIEDTASGGNAFSGRIGYGGDDAEVKYRIDTLAPELPPAAAPTPTPTPVTTPTPSPSPTPTPTVTPSPTTTPTPTPTPVPKPDLIISAFNTSQVTVRNQGAGRAGTFAVQVDGFAAATVGGLQPGEERTIAYGNGCNHGMLTVRADSLSQVDETDESNNAKTIDSLCISRRAAR